MKEIIYMTLWLWGVFLFGVSVGYFICNGNGILGNNVEEDAVTEVRYTCGVYAEKGWEIEGSMTCKKTIPLELDAGVR